VEQAEFKELSLTACADTGAMVSMAVFRNGTKVVRSFRPDFVLIRQNLKDAGEDYKNLLLGFKFGGVPSINNINAIYNFQASFILSPEYFLPSIPPITTLLLIFIHLTQDKPWVFAHLLQIQQRIGKDNFPLIDQTYYPAAKDMVRIFFPQLFHVDEYIY
jgi:synapsin